MFRNDELSKDNPFRSRIIFLISDGVQTIGIHPSDVIARAHLMIAGWYGLELTGQDWPYGVEIFVLSVQAEGEANIFLSQLSSENWFLSLEDFTVLEANIPEVAQYFCHVLIPTTSPTISPKQEPSSVCSSCSKKRPLKLFFFSNLQLLHLFCQR